MRKKPRWRPAENMAFFDHVVLDQKHAFDVQIPYIVFLSVWLIYLYLKGWFEKSEELACMLQENFHPFIHILVGK